MADSPPNRGTNSAAGDDTPLRPKRRPDTKTPRWLKVFGVIALVLVLLFVLLHLTGNNPGGPGRHGAAGYPQSWDSVPVSLVALPFMSHGVLAL